MSESVLVDMLHAIRKKISDYSGDLFDFFLGSVRVALVGDLVEPQAVSLIGAFPQSLVLESRSSLA